MASTTDMERAQRLTELIEDQGWSDADLARVLGVDRTRVWRWRAQGDKILSENLGSLARVLGTSRSWLASGQGERHVPNSDVLSALSEVERNVLDAINHLARDLGPGVGAASPEDVVASVDEARREARERKPPRAAEGDA